MVTHEIPKLECQVRDRIGTRYSRRLREAGRVPTVVYGHKQDPVHISLDRKAFEDLLHHEAHIVEVVVDGKGESCLIKDVQWDHLGKEIVHIDLARVDLAEEVEVEVELVLKGEAVGLKQAGTVLDHPITMIEIACRADSIPEHLEHDVSALDAGDVLTAADLVMPEGIRLVADPETIIASIQFTRAVEEEAEVAEAAAAEPEVIEKGKKEEEAEG